MRKIRTALWIHCRPWYHRVLIACHVAACAFLSCSSGNFDIAGGASDIGNSQEPQATVSDTARHSKETIIYDLYEGVIVIDSAGNRHMR